MMDAPKLFLDALEQNPRAKERFYMLTNMEKKLVVDEARQITDPERMQAHVSNIRE